MPENRLAYALVEKFGIFFVDGMGGINANGVNLIVSQSQCQQSKQAELITQIGIYLSYYLNRKNQHEQ